MKVTHHLLERMNQRAINSAMIDLVVAFGDSSGDKLIISKKSATALIKEFEYELADLLKN